MSHKNSVDLVNVNSLPKFNGSGNVHKFIREFKTIIRTQTDSEKAKIKLLLQCLIDLPRGTVKIHEISEEFKSTEDIFKILLDKFAAKPRVIKSGIQFWQLRPESDETLISFVGRLFDFYHDNQLETRELWTNSGFQSSLVMQIIMYFDLFGKGVVKENDIIKTVDELLEICRDEILVEDKPVDIQFFTPQSTFKKQVRYDPRLQEVEYDRDMNETNESYDTIQLAENHNDYDEYQRIPRTNRRIDFERNRSFRYSPYENSVRRDPYENSPKRRDFSEPPRYNEIPNATPRYSDTPITNRRQPTRGNFRARPYHSESARKRNFREGNSINRAPP